MGGMGKMEGKKLCQTNAKNVVQGNEIPNQTPNPNRTQLNWLELQLEVGAI